MNLTLLAVIMLTIVVAAIISNKISMNFVMFIVPTVFIFIMGFNLTDASALIVGQLNTIMGSVGYMLLFGLIYFTMLTETGMFSILINKLLDKVGGKLNVVGIMVLTTIIGAIGFLTANMSTTYLICFPIMIPLYNRFKLNRQYAFLICQTAIGMMCWLPWGIAIINAAMMAGTDALSLSSAAVPWGLCFLPTIVLQWVYFAYKHKQEHGTLGLPKDAHEVEQTEAAANPNHRPQLVWVNVLIFLCVIVALAYFKIPSYLVFIAASIITSMINYPKNFGEIWNKASTSFFNILIMLLAICFYLAAFNATPNGGDASMLSSLAHSLESIFPAFMVRYIHIVFLILAPIIIYFVPFQLYQALYPLFISLLAPFGIPAVTVVAPFVCNLSLATSVTPMNSATYVGCGLCDIEVGPYTKKGVGIMFVSNIIVILTALLTGVLHF